MPNILFTGFEPFSNWKVNPTEEAVHTLTDHSFSGYTVVGKVIKLEYYTIRDQLARYIQETEPDAIILSGQSGGDKIRLEQQAVNEATARVPYNCGTTVQEEILVNDGLQNYHSTLPLDSYYKVLQEHDIPVRYSDSAGRFGCNQIFYYARHYHAAIPSGFIHVPSLPSQTTKPEFMEQEVINQALELILKTTARWLANEL